MEWLAPALIVTAVVLSVPLLVWYTKQRGWNVEHEDDARREDE